MPLFWMLFTITTYLAAFLSCYLVSQRSQTDDSSFGSQPSHSSHSSQGTHSTHGSHLSSSQDCKRIFCCCYKCSKMFRSFHITPVKEVSTPAAVMMQMFACCLAFVQIALGTLILSALIFIGFHDTLGILGRLVASALVCRLIVLSQLVEIRDSLQTTA